VLASHHNNRTLTPNQRQLTDEQTKRLIQRGAVIARVDTWMMISQLGARRNEDVRAAGKIVDHIDRVCHLAGNAKPPPSAPIWTAALAGNSHRRFGHIADLQRIPDMLRKRGYKEADIEGVMHANWCGFSRTHGPKKT